MSTDASSSSTSTSVSLLRRAQNQEPDAWRRLVGIYVPVVYAWARHAGLQSSDAADLGQEVFQTVHSRLGDFRRDREGDTFRGWLWGITRNKLREFARRRAASAQAVGGSTARGVVDALADLPADESIDFQQSDSRENLIHRALDAIRVEFHESTWRAFWRFVVDERKTAEIADELGMTQKAVRQAKYRVLRRLRQELADLA